MEQFEKYQPIQERVMQALTMYNDWVTVGEVARRLGMKPSTTIRVILDTLAYTGWIYRQWGWTGKQNSYFYKVNRKVSDERH